AEHHHRRDEDEADAADSQSPDPLALSEPSDTNRLRFHRLRCDRYMALFASSAAISGATDTTRRKSVIASCRPIREPPIFSAGLISWCSTSVPEGRVRTSKAQNHRGFGAECAPPGT